MLRMRVSVVVVLLSLGMNGGGGAGCGKKREDAKGNVSLSVSNNATAQPTPGRAEETVNGEIKVLAGGVYGKVTEAFIAVVRDGEAYAALRELVGELPQVNADFFNQHLVIAAFLGQRNTGGYGVQIALAAENRVRISATSPPAGSMTTQALTAPFKIVSVPASDNRSLAIEVDAAWNKEMRPYRVSSGDFTTGGGFAGRFEKLQLAGDIKVGRLGRLATFVFDLKSTGGAKPRLLQNAATGVVIAGGQFSGAVVDAGSLVDFPRSPLGIKGSFAANEDRLSLTFEPLPSNVADGYEGRGKLEATATAPPPPKKPKSDDAPM